jgi:hypothetical protein
MMKIGSKEPDLFIKCFLNSNGSVFVVLPGAVRQEPISSSVILRSGRTFVALSFEDREHLGRTLKRAMNSTFFGIGQTFSDGPICHGSWGKQDRAFVSPRIENIAYF